MIVRTYRQCIKVVPAELVYVATDDDNIRAVCEKHGIQVVMTAKNCLTGTDRVAEVAQKIEADTYINVQGDEPVFNPSDLTELISAAEKNPKDVINGYCSIKDEVMFRSGSVPKVVMRADGRLLYMSRAPIPTSKGLTFVKSWRQVCAYAFPNKALEAFSSRTSKTELEEIEDIEILRFLELGWDIRMVAMSDLSVSVDNPEDIIRAEAAIRSLGYA
jgi:3-deoxy-manno-octulosonate cytidylyltransferase (CMP-KDO synthetase)